MKKNLLSSPSNLFMILQPKSNGFLYTLLLVFCLGFSSKTVAQNCVGPYKAFESFKTAVVPSSWSLNTGATAFTVQTGSANSRSGLYYLQQSGTNSTVPAGGNYPSVITSAYTNPKLVSFYVNRNAAFGVALPYIFQYSPDGLTWYTMPAGTNTVNGVIITATYPTIPTPAGPSGYYPVTALFNTNNPSASYKFRISDARSQGIFNAGTGLWPGTGGSLWLDDFSVTTYTTTNPSAVPTPTTNDNLIVVPELGATTICTVNVPPAGDVSYSFYDQGGLSDVYVKSQNQTMYFAPSTAGEKVQLTFNSFVVDASTKIIVYNGDSSLVGVTEFITPVNFSSPGVSSVTAGTKLTSTATNGYITVKFVTSGSAVAFANTGFDITVKCVGPPTITNLLTPTQGCDGSTFAITGTNLLDASSVTVGVAAATIVNNTSNTSLIISANGLSGVVRVYTPGGYYVDSTSTYTSNPLPTTVTVSTAGTYCNSTTLTADNLSSGTIYYQGTTSGGTSTATPSASQSISSSGTYYFRAQSALGCWSIQGSAAVVINPLPTAVTVSGGGTFCSSTTITASGGSGGTIYYQGTTSGGTSTLTPSASQSISSSGIYYFRAQSAAGCWGTEGSATVTINPLPTTVTVSGAGTFCGSTTITADNFSSGTIYYQGTTSGGTSTVTPSVSEVISSPGTYYFRAQSALGCWSIQGSAAVVINPLPTAVTVSGGGPSCGSATLTASNSSSGTIYYQGTTSGGTSTLTPSVSQSVSSSGLYYFRAYDGVCWGTEGSATVTINPLPTTVTVSGGGPYCNSTTITADNLSSGTIYYQGTTTGGTSTATASTSQLISASGTYYFRARSAAGCWGTQGSAAVTINTPPALAPVATAATPIASTSFSANWGTVTGATGYFLDVATDSGFTSMISGSPFTLGNVITYSVTGLSFTTTYYYRVRVTNGCLNATNSNIINCTTASASYCVPTYSSGDLLYGDNIANVTLGTLNNTTGASASPYYTFYNAATVPNLYQGATVTISVSFGTDANQYTGVWIDFNQNGTFETSEGFVSVNNAGSNGIVTLSIPVPSGAVLGNTRMRVRGGDDSQLTTSIPCGASSSSFGETEDYIVNIIAVPACAVSTPIGLTTTNVNATSATLVWTDSAMTPNSIYNYYVSTTNTAPPADGSNPVGMGTVTGALTANITGLSLGVPHYFWIRSKCDATNYSAWIGSATFTPVTLDIVLMTTGSVTTCNAKFYDSTGFTGVYNNNENSTYTFTPASGTNLKVVFNSFATESGWDFLYIYDGPTTASPLLGTFSGIQIAAGQTFYSTTANGGSLTFKFTSDGGGELAGWDADITCVVVPVVSSFSPTTACAGTTPVVTISGSNFTGATSVSFGGVSVSPTLVTATSITATLPAGALSGLVGVTTSQATAYSSTSFIVKPIPATPNAGSDVSLCLGSSTTLNATTTTSLSPSGVGGTTNSTSRLPFRTYYEDSKTQFLVLASELSAAGYTAGDFTSLSFNVSSNDPYTMNNFNVSMKNSGITAFNSGYETGLTNVYSGSYSVAGTGWQAITFGSNFTWDGVSNVVIQVCYDNSSLAFSSSSTIYYMNNPGGTSRMIYDYADGVSGCSIASYTTSTARPNMKFGFIPSAVTYNWTPTTALSNAAIYNPVASPTSTITYSVATTYNGCTSATDDVVVTVTPIAAGTASSDQSICGGSPADIILTGSSGTIQWQSADNFAFTTNMNPISGATSSTLTSAQMGALTTNRYYRAMLTNGSCTLYSNIVTILISGTTTTWTGSAWSNGNPSATKAVVFNGTYSSDPLLNSVTPGNISACSISVTALGSVDIIAGHTVTVQNTVTVATGGSLTFEDGSSLYQPNAVTNATGVFNGGNSGNITFMRTASPMYKFDYTYWSSPVYPQNLLALSPLSPLFYQYDGVTANQWQYVNAGSTVMSVGRGYLVRAPSNFPIYVTPLTPLPSYYTGSFIGVPNNGSQSIQIGVAQGVNQFNLIGNPYPSSLLADNFIMANPNVGALYFWTHNTNISAAYQYTNDDYAVYTLAGGVGTRPSGVDGAGVNASPTGFIASGQGFFTKGVASITGAGPTYYATFTNSMRTAGNNGQFFKTNSAVAQNVNLFERHRYWLNINNEQGAFRQVLVGYIETATMGIDRLFEGQMSESSNVISLYTLVDSNKMAIQGRPLPFDVSDTVPLCYKSTIASTYTIEMPEYDGLFTSQHVYLEDTLLQVIHDLSVSPYTFATESGTFENRFILRYTMEALGTPVFNESSVVVYRNEQGLFIHTGTVSMQAVKIYDIRGRLLTSRDAINATETSFTTLPATQQVLLVQITSEEGISVTKKVVY